MKVNCVEDLNLAAAYWSIDSLSVPELLKTAATAIEYGYDSKYWVELMADPSTTKRDLNDLFLAALDESKVVVPSKEKAVVVIAKYYAKRIIDKTITPYEGVVRIVEDVCYVSHHTPRFLQKFIGFESEYSDLMDVDCANDYDEGHYVQLKQSLNEKIIKEAILLQKYKA